MQPKIVALEPFAVVGLKYHGKNAEGEIPEMWGALMQRSGEIQGLVDRDNAYGLSDNMDCETGEFDYVAGLAVSTAAPVPAGMVRWQVPGGTYALVTCTLPTLGETFNTVYNEWFPNSGYVRSAGPEVEVYDEEFDAQDPDSKMKVYIPVRPAGA